MESLVGSKVKVTAGHVGSWAFGLDPDVTPESEVIAEGLNYLAPPRAHGALKKALLLKFASPVDYEGLRWQYAIATVRYLEEPFDELVRGRPVTAYVRYIADDAMTLGNPFVGAWSEKTPFVIAKLTP